jgi:S-DNA-T family DNA segregation ATPase FtsK/SpoIIIE
LGIGYGRAARLIDFMAEDGIVGTYNGSQAREVLLTADQWAQMSGSSGTPAVAPPAAPPPRASRVLTVSKPTRPLEDEDDEELDEEEDDELEEDSETEDEYEEDYDEADEEESDEDDGKPGRYKAESA